MNSLVGGNGDEGSVGQVSALTADSYTVSDILSDQSPGSSTVSPQQLLFRENGKLYGRSRQEIAVKSAFEKSRTSRQLLFIAGEAGSGKSSLAHSIRPVAQEQKGFYMFGKFKQKEEDSNSGISDAFQEVCLNILEHRFDPELSGWEVSFDEIRDRMLENLGSDVELLFDLIPRLKLIVETGRDPMGAGVENRPSQSGDSGYQERKYRIGRALRLFIRTLSQFGPVVFALDDLQWADDASLELMELFALDSENTSIMIVGIYRSEGVQDGHKLLTFIDDLKTKAANMGAPDADSNDDVTEIMLDGLKTSDINEMLTDLLNTPSCEETRVLAECVHEKTLGNSFFVVRFLKVLAKDDLLQYSWETKTWSWDTDIIRKQTTSTENVVDFLVGKLQEVPTAIRRLLPIVASLGHVFTKEIVEILMGEMLKDICPSPEDRKEVPTATKFLRKCQREGLIFKVRDNYYQWEHDKLQVSSTLCRT